MYNVLVLLVFTACILSCAYGKNLIVNSFYQVVGNFLTIILCLVNVWRK